MRSSGFVFLSILFHVACVMAIAFTPTRIVSDAGDAPVEISMGEPAEKAGLADAPESVEPSKPQEIVKAPPQPVAAAPTPAPPKVAKAKPVVAPVPVPVKTKSSATKAVAPSAVSAVAAVPTEAGEAPVAEAFVPVKETPPVGVEANNAAEDAETHEAPPVAAAPTPKPTAPPVAEAAPVAAVAATGTGAVAAAAVTSEKEQPTGEASKGGESKEGAVSYLELKQSPGNKPPAYPQQARRESRQGELELVYRVTPEGKVADVQVAKSSGFKDLDAEAMRAITQYRFVPGQEGWARHPINFALKGEAKALPARLRTKSAAQAQVDP